MQKKAKQKDVFQSRNQEERRDREQEVARVRGQGSACLHGRGSIISDQSEKNECGRVLHGECRAEAHEG